MYVESSVEFPYNFSWPLGVRKAGTILTLMINIVTILVRFNEGVYNFLKSNSLVYNFTYKLHFTILGYEQNFEGGFR